MLYSNCQQNRRQFQRGGGFLFPFLGRPLEGRHQEARSRHLEQALNIQLPLHLSVGTTVGYLSP